MQEPHRPKLSLDCVNDPIAAFVSELQDAIDTGDVTKFNRHFAHDVLWGSPFGAVAVGYDQIHAIHAKMFSSVVAVKGAARYTVEHTMFVSDDVAIAYIRRISTQPIETTKAGSPASFDELALIVLVRREDQWWLAAAQHVPDRRDVYSKN